LTAETFADVTPDPDGMPYEPRGAIWTVWANRDLEVLVEGPGGTGKSRGILEKIHRTCLKYPRIRVLMLRKTRASMTESTLVTFEQEVLVSEPSSVTPAVGKLTRGGRDYYGYENGSHIVLGGMDDPTKLFSTQYDIIYINEANELSLTEYESLFRALRNNRLGYHQVLADVNPVHPGHWLNKRADPCDDSMRISDTVADYERLQAYNLAPREGKMKRIVTRHQDNPAFWDMPKWKWTQRGLHYVETVLGAMSGFLYSRMKNGLWVAASGTVYGSDFLPARNVIAPFAVPGDWPVALGLDPGYDHPCAILWIAVAPNDCLYIFDEIYVSGKEVKEHADAIRRRTHGRDMRWYLADPQQAFSSQAFSGNRTIAKQFKECGLTFQRWPRTGDNAEAMVDAVRSRLRAGTLKVFSTCLNTIDEFQSWSYKRTKSGELPPGDDAFEDRNNHAMDVVRGVVAFGPRFGGGAVRAVTAGPRVDRDTADYLRARMERERMRQAVEVQGLPGEQVAQQAARRIRAIGRRPTGR
jgi:phage terminase large subunit